MSSLSKNDNVLQNGKTNLHLTPFGACGGMCFRNIIIFPVSMLLNKLCYENTSPWLELKISKALKHSERLTGSLAAQ